MAWGAFDHGDCEIETADELAREQARGLAGEGGMGVHDDCSVAEEEVHAFLVDLAADGEDGRARVFFARGKLDPGEIGDRLPAPMDISL